MNEVVDVKAKLAVADRWEGLGADLTGGSIDEWKKQAGLDFEVREAVVQFRDVRTPDVFQTFGDRKVLYRGDTMKPLATVSKGYKTVQPGEVLEFFRDLTEQQGFTMEVAGSLQNGKKVWALAKVSEGSNVLGADRVMPYVMLATSFDGGLATTAKFTARRNACNNMLTVALSGKNGIKIPHGVTFNADAVKRELGLTQTAWSRWLETAKRAASAPLTPELVSSFTSLIAVQTIPTGADVAESKAYKQIMDLFNGGALGSDMTQGPTAWQWLNSVTEYVDHHKGRAADSRVNRAWFGDGDALKTRAFNLVSELVA